MSAPWCCWMSWALVQTHRTVSYTHLRFKLEEELLQEEQLAIMEQIARNRGCLLKGGRIDYTKVSRAVIGDFRQAKIGRITLE